MHQAPFASMALEFLIGALITGMVLHGCASFLW